MFETWDVWVVRCLGCGMFGMFNACDVGCGMWDVCLDVGSQFTKFRLTGKGNVFNIRKYLTKKHNMKLYLGSSNQYLCLF